MIYFENYVRGHAGLNNHVISYTLCIALSNFLGRDFYFDHEVPSYTPPDYAAGNHCEGRYDILMKSPRSLVSNLVDIPARRISDIDRSPEKKAVIPEAMKSFVTDAANRDKYAGTMIWDSFSIGRPAFVKEELLEAELIEVGPRTLVNPGYFFFLELAEKKSLLESVRLRYRHDIERLAASMMAERGKYNALHMRLGDFQMHYGRDGWQVDEDLFRRAVGALFEDREIPLLIATDGLHEKELFARLLSGYKYEFIDEIVFDSYFDAYRELEFTDHNALSIIDQLICTGSDKFIGTFRSTFTSIIHRLRQERCGKTDFWYFPDGRVRMAIGPDFKLRPDLRGFFEWNLYSAFRQTTEHPSWVREWNVDMTAVSG